MKLTLFKATTIVRFFEISAASLLLATAVAKFISSSGNAKILNMPDTILRIHYRYLFILIGLIEVAVAWCCIFDRSKIGLLGITYLSTNYLIYRLGLLWSGYHKPCSCLGNLTDALHIPPQTADTAMKIILAYFLIGSYGILLHLWWKNRKLAVGRSALGSEGKATPA
jgi:Methylamine utilisation protein MauE